MALSRWHLPVDRQGRSGHLTRQLPGPTQQTSSSGEQTHLPAPLLTCLLGFVWLCRRFPKEKGERLEANVPSGQESSGPGCPPSLSSLANANGGYSSKSSDGELRLALWWLEQLHTMLEGEGDKAEPPGPVAHWGRVGEVLWPPGNPLPPWPLNLLPSATASPTLPKGRSFLYAFAMTIFTLQEPSKQEATIVRWLLPL